MTAQIPERLLYEGEEVSMCTIPLVYFFAEIGENPQSEIKNTALRRGYFGQWQISDDHLYLVALQGTLQGGAEVSVATFFPGSQSGVFAHWYSGTISIPRGLQLKYMQSGFGIWTTAN